MSVELIRGQKIAVAPVDAGSRLQMAINVSGFPISALQCAGVVSYGGMVELLHSGKPLGGNGSIRMSKGRATPSETGEYLAKIDINLSTIPEAVSDFFCLLSVPETERRRGRNLEDLGDCRVTLAHDGAAVATFPFGGETFSDRETAVYLLRLYRYRTEWKVGAVAQGFCGGLGDLFEQLGIPDVQQHVGKLEHAAQDIEDAGNGTATFIMREVHDALIDLVGTQGLQFYGAGPGRVRSFLMDIVPRARREIKVLTAVVEIGALDEIRNPRQASDVLLPRLAGRVEDECWIPREAADWAVRVWAAAFGSGTGQGELITVETGPRPSRPRSRAAPPTVRKNLQNGERWTLPETMYQQPLFISIRSFWSATPSASGLCILLGGNGRAIKPDGFIHAKGAGSNHGLVKFNETQRSSCHVIETYQLDLSASGGVAAQVQRIAFLVGPTHPQGATPRIGHDFSSARLSVGVSQDQNEARGDSPPIAFHTPSVSPSNAYVVRAFEIYRRNDSWKLTANPVGYAEGWAEVMNDLGFRPSSFIDGFE